MTFHSRRTKQTRRPTSTNKFGHKLSPRVSVSLDPDDFAVLSQLAQKRQEPLAQVMRDAAKAYRKMGGVL